VGLKFINDKGERIGGVSAATLLFVVAPLNFFALSYLTMILAGVLHSDVLKFPALGFWTSACVVAIFKVLSWEKGPIRYDGKE
jgi:hypothetical protein